MLASLIFLLLAASSGSYLALGFLRGVKPRAADRMIGLVHGAIGTVGLLELVVGLSDVRHLAARGLGGFGEGAEWLLGAAILLGLIVVLPAWQGRRPSGLAIAAHASAAISAIALVMALVSLG